MLFKSGHGLCARVVVSLLYRQRFARACKADPQVKNAFPVICTCCLKPSC